jgi:hypothetical protein
MTMQSLCHGPSARLALLFGSLCCCALARADEDQHDYPTHARVEYVQECMLKHGGQLAALHQCSCVIDAIAKRLGYDEYVEAATFARYATLGGDGGGVFRDSEHAKTMAKLYRSIEAEAQQSCGLAKK